MIKAQVIPGLPSKVRVSLMVSFKPKSSTLYNLPPTILASTGLLITCQRFFKVLFSLELFAITSFSELLVNPFTRVIDLEKIPQDIRGRMYGNLNRFGDGIHTLKLGSGSGGMVPEAYSETFIKGNGIIAV